MIKQTYEIVNCPRVDMGKGVHYLCAGRKRDSARSSISSKEKVEVADSFAPRSRRPAP